MRIINDKSLAVTLDNLNQLLFENKTIKASEKIKAARWISGRQGLEHSYWGMFAPTELDYKGVKLFTGEPLTTGASIGHVLGEESCRIMYLLDVENTKSSIENAQKGLEKAITRARDSGYNTNGYYCCGKCTIAYWRNLSAEGLDKNKKVLKAGIKILREHRDGLGRWKRFPFYYTLLSLSGIDLPESKEELKYASRVCERVLIKNSRGDKYSRRRQKLAEIILEMI